VSSARDFTDSRTHEASGSGVHGITGSFVDTLSTQTLSNKTLNNPTINNATVTGTVVATGASVTNGTFNTPGITSPTISNPTISGTVAGTPTFGGVPTFSAGLVAEGVTAKKPLGTDLALIVKRDADTIGRLTGTADGALNWGPGGGSATDTTLARSGAGALGLTGSLTASGGLNGASVTATGLLTGSDLSLTGQVWTTFTPVWHGTDADMTNNIGWYTKYGKLVIFEIYTVFGSSSSSGFLGSVRVDAPTTPFRNGSGANTTRQVLGTVWYNNVLPGGNFPDTNCMGFMSTFAGDSGVNTQPLVNYRSNTFTGGLIGGPSPATIITINGSYREA